jgi:hypothetical protein
MEKNVSGHLIINDLGVPALLKELEEQVKSVSSSPKIIKTYGSVVYKKSMIERSHHFRNSYCENAKMTMEPIVESSVDFPSGADAHEEDPNDEYEYEDDHNNAAYFQFQHHSSPYYSPVREVESEPTADKEGGEIEVVYSVEAFPSLERSSSCRDTFSTMTCRDPWNNNTFAEMEWMETVRRHSLSNLLDPFPSAFSYRSDFLPLFSSSSPSPPPPPPLPSLLINCLLSLSVSVIKNHLCCFLLETANNGVIDSKEWKSLVNTSKKFLSLRKETIYLSLNHHYSVQYYLNPFMRKKILKRISDPSQQIALKLDERVWIPRDNEESDQTDDEACIDSLREERIDKKEEERSDFKEEKEENKEYKQRNKWNHRYLQRINNVHVLHISNNPGLTTISFLTKIGKYLNLSHCNDLQDISAFSTIFNNADGRDRGDKASKIEEITTEMTDDRKESNDGGVISCSRSLMINLSYCPKITDFSSFSLISSSVTSSFPVISCLLLHHNPQLIDVSPFQHIKHLDISCCSSLTNVAPLWKNYSLKARNCENVRNWTILTNVIHLNLSYNKNLYFLPTICSQTKTIKIDYCNHLESINELTESFRLENSSFSSAFSSSSLASATATSSVDFSSFSSTVSSSLSSFISSLSSVETDNKKEDLFDSALTNISMVGCHNLSDITCLACFPNLLEITLCYCMKRLVAPWVEARKKGKMMSGNQQRRLFQGKLEFKNCSSTTEKKRYPRILLKSSETMTKSFPSQLYCPDYNQLKETTRKEIGNKKRDSDEGENSDLYEENERKKAKSPRKEDVFNNYSDDNNYNNNDTSIRRFKSYGSNASSSSTSSLPTVSALSSLSKTDFPITIKKEDFPYLSPSPSPVTSYQMTPLAVTMNRFRGSYHIPTVFNDAPNTVMNQGTGNQDDDDEVKRFLDQEKESWWSSIR